MQIAIARSKKNIEDIATSIRNKFNCTDFYFDIIKFVEIIIPSIDGTFNYEYVESSELPENTYAFYDSTNNQMKIHSSVYDRACQDVGRDRFTIAHEVGHYVLHREGCFFARSNIYVPTYMNPEWQANTFASALLIPRSMTFSLSAYEIAEKCKVSYQAAEIACKCN